MPNHPLLPDALILSFPADHCSDLGGCVEDGVADRPRLGELKKTRSDRGGHRAAKLQEIQMAWVKVIVTSGQFSANVVSASFSGVSTVSHHRSFTVTHSPVQAKSARRRLRRDVC